MIEIHDSLTHREGGVFAGLYNFSKSLQYQTEYQLADAFMKTLKIVCTCFYCDGHESGLIAACHPAQHTSTCSSAGKAS